ncbi:secretory phospholipase A2 receptor-like [Crassostrea angulata]|uniref:secretory phospholipase A2 receptor-like n=1 Tax=Magallana angulata TaxID=2784310 RepID=UPI0022B13108|nr:secretory phospholipase A2 receptor-like [Crassostrea angulata]
MEGNDRKKQLELYLTATFKTLNIMFEFNASTLFLYVFFLFYVWASCLQIADKRCLAMSRKLEFDNYALIAKNFRIQEINGILRPECVHQCLRNGTKCVGVLVNEIFQSCWLLKCSMNLRLLQKGFLQLSNGWNYYANGDACRPGWDPFNGHCYFFENSVKETRTGASSRCNDLGGYLVQIENEEENTWLTNYYAIDESNINRHYKFAVWIGAISSSPTGPYRWELSGPTLDYQPWYPGNPTYNVELCVNLLGSGMWNDIMCDNSYYFVCESD